MTVQELINQALMDIGALSPGEAPSASESDFGLAALNQIISSWSLERTAVYSHTHQAFVLQKDVAAYTLGPGGTWAVFGGRPVRITGARASYLAFEQGLKVLGLAEYSAAIQNGQGITAMLPSLMGVDSAAPLVNVRLYPTPSFLGVSIEVDFWEALEELSGLGDQVSFPVPGYLAALRAELAVTIAPSFGASVPTELASNMRRFKQRIQDLNASIEGMPAAPAQPAPPQQ